MFGLPAFPYPPARPEDGYWSPVTSTINWCEEVRKIRFQCVSYCFSLLIWHSQDYYATIYSAEIVNSMTNLLFMALGIRGILNCIKNGHDTIFLISFLGYSVIGAGSFAFHSSLKCMHTTNRIEGICPDWGNICNAKAVSQVLDNSLNCW